MNTKAELDSWHFTDIDSRTNPQFGEKTNQAFINQIYQVIGDFLAACKNGEKEKLKELVDENGLKVFWGDTPGSYSLSDASLEVFISDFKVSLDTGSKIDAVILSSFPTFFYYKNEGTSQLVRTWVGLDVQFICNNDTICKTIMFKINKYRGKGYLLDTMFMTKSEETF